MSAFQQVMDCQDLKRFLRQYLPRHPTAEIIFSHHIKKFRTLTIGEGCDQMRFAVLRTSNFKKPFALYSVHDFIDKNNFKVIGNERIGTYSPMSDKLYFADDAYITSMLLCKTITFQEEDGKVMRYAAYKTENFGREFNIYKVIDFVSVGIFRVELDRPAGTYNPETDELIVYE